MPLSLNEIKDRALAFSREWEGERAERAEAQTFWNEFFNVFGVSLLADTAALERQIDEMVDKLYGLTPDEIEIVEGTN
ncbi:MAG TPA: hypothetical protein DHV16_07500 [Nitrospiraceae bacterium]|nr:MAG: hypothetical protein A2X55_05120 [Nitrospirae bacterium GWB2_47_37]HAK88695.1 hypothetical protein [Nitrospiraceae bacterium]HCZ12084.1 hypothetical protein [Nitrospiraceae bacterium]